MKSNEPEGLLVTLWTIVGWFYKVISMAGSWLFSDQEKTNLSDNMPDLVKHAIERQSWFDRISSWWYSHSFSMKLTNAFGFIAAISLLSLFTTSAPWLVTISTGILTLITHMSLTSHEENRREMIKGLAKEAIDLQKNLQDKIETLEDKISALEETIQATKKLKDEAKAQLAALQAVKNSVNGKNDALGLIVETVKVETNAMLVQEKAVTENFATVAQGLDACGKVIDESINSINSVGSAATELHKTIQEVKKQQQIFADTTNRFCLFVNTDRQPIAPKNEPTKTDDFIAQLDLQMDEDEALIREWQTIR